MRTPLDTTNRPQQGAIRYIAPRSGTPNDGDGEQKAIKPGNEHGETVGRESDDVERVSQVLEMTNGVSAVYKLYFLVSYASTRLTCVLYILPHSSEALARNYPSHRPRGSYAPLPLSLRTSTITHRRSAAPEDASRPRASITRLAQPHRRGSTTVRPE
jgi:hypothetical protein